MSRFQIDHITITAPTLDAGAAYVAGALGLEPGAGGQHPHMGTHNLLLGLGEATFMEVIAVNPAAAPPPRPRWFALDEPQTEARVAAWVVRVADIDAAARRLPEPLGPIERLSRGDLQWLMTVLPSGRLPLGGAAPVLIQWQGNDHPARQMRRSGCSLRRLQVFHPRADRVETVVAALELQDLVEVAALPPEGLPSLIAHIDTPQGVRSIGSLRWR